MKQGPATLLAVGFDATGRVTPDPERPCKMTHGAVVADAGGLPAAVVPAGVALVQLEPIVLVPAHVQQRHAKRTLA